ncbi:MAG TPA: hypothetical protein VI653_18470, partial [Steroidobacteraceae bacterium]
TVKYAIDVIRGKATPQEAKQFLVDTAVEGISAAADAFAPGAAKLVAGRVVDTVVADGVIDVGANAGVDAAAATAAQSSSRAAIIAAKWNAASFGQKVLATTFAGGAQSVVQAPASLANTAFDLSTAGQLNWTNFRKALNRQGLDILLGAVTGGVSGGLSPNIVVQTAAGFGSGVLTSEVNSQVFDHRNLTTDDWLSSLIMAAPMTAQHYTERANGFDQIKDAIGGGAPAATQTYQDGSAPSDGSDEVISAVPRELRGSTYVDLNLGRDARVVYEVGSGGLISRVELHVGREASAADIAAHAEVAKLMLKYQGLGGRLRRLRDAFANLFSGPENQRPQVGSRAWEARLELIKLDRMMQQRQAELALYANRFTGPDKADPTLAGERDWALEGQLYQDLDSLQQQFDQHAVVLDAIHSGMEGAQGYVAVKGLSAGEALREERGYPEAEEGYYWRLRKRKLEYVAMGGGPQRYFDETEDKFLPVEGSATEPRFADGVDKEAAFRDLGGYGTETSLGKFVKVLLDLKIVESPAHVVDKIEKEPANLTKRTVRHNLKEEFREAIVDRITNESYLQDTDRYKQVFGQSRDDTQALRAAGMERLSYITDTLASEDQGSFGERVYARLFGTDESWVHVNVSREALADIKKVSVDQIESSRQLDRLDGTTAREIKNVTTRLGARERGQIDDMVSMVNKSIIHEGVPRKVEDVAVAFPNGEGGLKNASLAFDILTAHPDDPLTFEFHAADGTVVKVNHANREILLDQDKFAERLRASTT